MEFSRIALARRALAGRGCPAASQPIPSTDISSLSAMLSAKWKQGGGTAKSNLPEPVRAGQIRSFRILKLDQASKKIEVELAG